MSAFVGTASNEKGFSAFINTRGSVWIAMLLHSASNAASQCDRVQFHRSVAGSPHPRHAGIQTRSGRSMAASTVALTKSRN